ncbi:MAG: hypothetical protein IKN53_03390, partial [Oscillibacter sp.]|nr:hypothetical protein [Oscillibacter sp.]
MRKLLGTILLAAMLFSLVPALPAEAAEAASDELQLAYEVDFRGTKDIFEPMGVAGAFANFTYTPSADGSAITIKGVDYEGKDPNGKQQQAYWGGKVMGLTANSRSIYELTYKVRNDSTKAYSQVGIGGLIPETGIETTFWNVASTYNASGNVVLGMLTGNTGSVGGPADAKNILQKTADRDADGFISVKLRFNGVRETMTLFAMLDGEWKELYERDITISSGCHMAVMFYSLRSGAINMTIKDMKFYANQGKKASTTESEDADEDAVTGYDYQKKIVTLAEVKPRYGIEKKLSAAGGVTGVATFRDRMDAYLAYVPYQANMGVTLRDPFSADSAKYKELYVTFRAAIDPEEDTAIQDSPELVKLYVTSDGKTWQDSGATFTVAPTGEKTVAAAKVATDSEGNYLFDDSAMIPVYEFTSTTFAPNNIQNVRLVPSGNGKGTFRLVSLYVWADTGETIAVPLLDGNLNTTVAKSKKGTKTLYDLYSTDFTDTNGWTSNFVNFRDRTSETVGGVMHPYCYFTASGVLPTMDGMQGRIYSPDMELSLKEYDKVRVQFKCFRIDSEGDADLKDMLLGYSTDHGATWVQLKTKPTLERVQEGAVDGNGYTTYSVSVDLKESVPNNTVITNVVILPYGNKVWYTIDLIGGNPDLLRRVDGPMVGTKGAFRMLDFSITGVSADPNLEAEPIPVYQNHYDSTVIQMMINSAKLSGKTEVTIPPINPRTGTNVWTITRTIKVPSNMTLYINNCILRMGNYARCRMIQNEHCPSLHSTVALLPSVFVTSTVPLSLDAIIDS